MKTFITSVVLVVGATLVAGQRPFFAGSKPIGYPELATTEGLVDRFGEVDGTTQRLPVEANGDRDLIDRLSKLPIDQQPFWFINWQALEAHRQNPQTYPQRPSPFVPPNTGSGSSNFGIGSFNSGPTSSATVNSDTGTSSSSSSNSGSSNSNSGSSNSNSGSSSSNSGTSSSSSGTSNSNSGSSSSNSGSHSGGLTSSVASSNINTENRFGADNVRPTTTPNSQVIHGNFRPNVDHFNSGNKVVTTGNSVPNKQSYGYGKPL